MITGSHAIIYSKDAQADRVFLRDTLGFSDVDVSEFVNTMKTKVDAA